MATKTTRTVAPSRTRAAKGEVQQEFEAIRRDTDAAREAANPKSADAEQRHAAEIRQTVEALSVDSVAQRVSAVGSEISRMLMDLTGKLAGEVNLHKLDIAAIEGASGSRALSHVNQIAMEQAKGRPQG
jgi:uncharacterized small protein (DUF1192 family)